MFRKRNSQSSLRFEPTSRKQLFKRAATLSAGIFFLWIALHIMPKPGANIPTTEASISEVPTSPITPAGKQSETMGFLKSTQIIAGILLLGLIGFMYYRHKKVAEERGPIKSLKTLNKLQIGQNQHLYLIECGQQALLIGATSSQISLLHKVPLSTVTELQGDKSDQRVTYPFTSPDSTHVDSGNFASLLQAYSSANPN